MLSLASYFFAKKPDRQVLPLLVFTTVLVLGASCSVLTADFTAVLDLVVLAFSDLFDVFDFLVAIYSSFNDIVFIISQNCVL